MSQYIWRGYELSRNSIVIQPSMTLAYRGFSANVWGNLDTKPYYDGTLPEKRYSSAWNETDVTLSYTRDFGAFSLGAGYIYYGLGVPNTDVLKPADGQEIFVSASMNILLSPTLTVYKEISHYRNWYVLLDISHEIELTEKIGMQFAAAAGYLFSTDEASYPKYGSDALPTNDKFRNFHDGSVSIGLPVRVTECLTVTPAVSYAFSLSRDAKYEMKGLGLQGTAAPEHRDASFVFAGLTVAFAF